VVALGRLDRKDVLACGVLIAAAAAIGEASIFLRPDLWRNAGFLFGDAGNALLVAREVLHGARLYADVSYLYGVLPVYLFSAVAAVFGNTPVVYLQFLLACSLIDLGLFYALARRAAGPGLALGVSLLGALPVLLVPGALLGGYVNSYYIPVERGFMIAAALAWQPASRRGPGRAAVLGACLGVMQFVRFGPGIVLAAVIVLLDAVAHLVERRPMREWLAAEAWTLGAAAVIEAVRVAGAFALLPRSVAIDVVWPAYILPVYAGAASHPGWYGWRMAIGQYLNPATSIALACAGAGWAVSRRRLTHDDAAELILPVFFLAGVCGFFRTEFHYYQTAWALVPGSLVALRRWSGARVLAAAAWLPPFALVVSQPLRAPSTPMVTTAISDGWRLTVAADLVPRIDGIVGVLRGTREPVVFYPGLSGFNVALDRPLVGRVPYFMQGTVRPHEGDSLVRAFARARTLVTCRPAAAWTGSPGLFNPDVPPALRAAIEARAGEIVWHDSECRAVRLRP
jgi:hypothetical protein